MDRFLRCVMGHYKDPPPPLHFCNLLSRGHSRGRSFCQEAGLAKRRFLLFDVGGVYTQSWARKKTPDDPQPWLPFRPVRPVSLSTFARAGSHPLRCPSWQLGQPWMGFLRR